jgi:hypothetical protein
MAQKTGCGDACLAMWSGLNFLSVGMIRRKREEFAETIVRNYGAAELPGLTVADVLILLDEAIKNDGRIRGLGDLVARGLQSIGITGKRNCGCGRRRAKLNRLIPFRS